MKRKVKTLIIVGPSGVGKSRLIQEISKFGVYPLKVYTDRERRPQENKFTDREYLSKDEFTSQTDEFLYWHPFQGNRYGYKTKDIKKHERLGNHISFDAVPALLPEFIKKLPHAVIIYLWMKEENFPLLYERMAKRDIAPDDTKKIIKKKLKKIQNRLDYAREEIAIVEKIKDEILSNSESKFFDIEGDSELYESVIPYIKNLL